MSTSAIDFSKYESASTGAPSQIDFSKYEQASSPAAQKPKSISDYASDFGKHFAAGLTNPQSAWAPNIALQLWRHLQGQPNTLKDLPADAVQKFLMAGGFDEAPPVPAEATKAASAAGATSKVLEHPAVRPWVDAAKAEIMKFPGANLAKTAYDSAKGLVEGAPAAPAAKVAPVPETNGVPWGSAGPGPLDLRGKIIPKEPVFPGASLPEHPGSFPGAPLPETPAPELLQAGALSKGPPQPPPEAAALKSVSVPAVKPSPVAPTETPTAVTPAAAESIPRTPQGDSVLREALTTQPTKTLLQIARSRGINVLKEAQLRPDLANPKIIDKIVDDFTPEELDEARSRNLETERHGRHNFGEIGKEANQALNLQTYFPDLKIPQAVLSRTAKAIEQNYASPARPMDLLGGKQAFKQQGSWFVKSGDLPTDKWVRVTEGGVSDLLDALGAKAGKGLAPAARVPAADEDLTGLLDQSVQRARASR